jgi:hypothetical protein
MDKKRFAALIELVEKELMRVGRALAKFEAETAGETCHNGNIFAKKVDNILS